MPTISNSPNTNLPDGQIHGVAQHINADCSDEAPRQQTSNAAARPAQAGILPLSPRTRDAQDARMRRLIAPTGQNERHQSPHIQGSHQQWLNLLSSDRVRLLNTLSPEMKKVFLAAHFIGESPLTEAESVVLADALKALTSLFTTSDNPTIPLAGNLALVNGAIHAIWERCLREGHRNIAPSLQFATPISSEAKLLAESLYSALEEFEELCCEDNLAAEGSLRISFDCENDNPFRHTELLTEDQQNALSQMKPLTSEVFCTAIITADPALTSERSAVLSEALIALDISITRDWISHTEFEHAKLIVTLLAYWEPSLEARRTSGTPSEERVPGDLSTQARSFLDNFFEFVDTSLDNIEAAPLLPQRRGAPDNYLTYRPMTLDELNIGGESPEQLITVPALGYHGLNQVQAHVDPQSSVLRGRAYLEFLTTDMRLMPAIGALIESDHVLGADSERTLEELNEIAERLRPVMAEVYRDPDLNIRVDDIASETLDDCDDRFDLYLSKMENAALLAHLSRGDIDEVVLYNHGISFFMLDEVRAATGRLYTELRVNPANQTHNVHDYLNAAYYLQDELHLPHRHARPIHLENLRITIVGPREARRIGEIVRERAIENDGQRAIEFMATWDPWVAHLKAQDALKPKPHFAKVMAIFQRNLLRAETARAIQGSFLHRMDKTSYEAVLGDIQARLREWQKEIAADHTRTFLFNHRADYLAELGRLPSYFSNSGSTQTSS